jgi:DNA-binding transcriptional ArsR family regulator
MEEDAERIREMLDATTDAASRFRIRWLIGRVEDLKLSKKVDEAKLSAFMDKTLDEELERSLILLKLAKEPMTVLELSEATHLEPKLVVTHLIALRKKRLVTEKGEKEGAYVYSTG